MNKTSKGLALAATCFSMSLYVMGCNNDSGSGGGSSTVSNAMTNTFSTVTSKVDSMNFSTNSSSSASLSQRTAFGSEWETNTNFPDSACSSSCGTATAKDWMGNEIDPDSVRDNGSSVSVFGRVDDALEIFCALGVGLSADDLDADLYPTNGTHNIVMTTALMAQMTSQCNISLDNVAADSVIPITVTSTTNTTTFDKSISFDLSNIGGGTQTYMLRSNSTAINIATVEVNSNGISRTTILYNVASDTVRVEYVSGPNAATFDNDNYGFYRLFYNATADEGYLMSIQENDQDASGGVNMQGTRYILAGKPNTTGGTFSLSMASDNWGLASPVEACVDKDTGNITGDGARCTPSSTALAGYPVNTNALFTGFVGAWNNADYNSISETTTLNFTNATDFETAATGKN